MELPGTKVATPIYIQKIPKIVGLVVNLTVKWPFGRIISDIAADQRVLCPGLGVTLAHHVSFRRRNPLQHNGNRHLNLARKMMDTKRFRNHVVGAR
jgi:hypothetical protein